MSLKVSLASLYLKLKNKTLKEEVLKIANKTNRTVLKLNKFELEELVSKEVEYEDELGNIAIPIMQ